MFQAYALYFAAFFIEILGITLSVIGVGQLVGMNLLIILMAISFDVGKIVTVSSLQKNWGTFPVLMKAYGLLAMVVTMMITSYGIAGYITNSIQKGMASVSQTTVKIDYLTAERNKLAARKKQIDDQVVSIQASIAPTDAPSTVRQKQKMIASFEAEQLTATTRLTEIDKELPALELEKLSQSTESSAIIALAKNLEIDVNTAIKYIVYMIMIVFDPFAIYLILSANHTMNKERMSRIVKVAGPIAAETTIDKEAPEVVESKISEPIFEVLKPTEQAVEDIDPPKDQNILSPTYVAVRSSLEDVPSAVDLFSNGIHAESKIAPLYGESNEKELGRSLPPENAE